MLGSILKLTLTFTTLFVFTTLLWQCSIIDATPIHTGNDNMVQSFDDAARILANKPAKGIKHLRMSKLYKNLRENRLKRFRMLDQDEFQEMLKSLGQQSADEQSKLSNTMDSLGGMQLANYWSH